MIGLTCKLHFRLILAKVPVDPAANLNGDNAATGGGGRQGALKADNSGPALSQLKFCFRCMSAMTWSRSIPADAYQGGRHPINVVITSDVEQVLQLLDGEVQHEL